MKIGFIGGGNMGGALASKLATSHGAELYISDKDGEKLSELCKSLGAKASENLSIAETCELIFLAVKPNIIPSVLEEIRETLGKRDDATLVSMAAGVSIKRIEEILGSTMPIIRIMPNTPVSVGRGVILAAMNTLVSKECADNFTRLMRCAGICDIIDESLIDAGTAVSGCGPAFAYMFIEAMAKGGASAGLSADAALTYAAETVLGAAKLLIESEREPSELIRAVCSPGGSTIEGVNKLSELGLYETVGAAVCASFEKTKLLGK